MPEAVFGSCLCIIKSIGVLNKPNFFSQYWSICFKSGFDFCDTIVPSSLNVGFGNGKISNFCLAASGLGDISLKKTKDTSATCLRYLEVDVRNVDYYGEYELGQVDTPGECIEFNFGDGEPLEDDC